MPFVRRQRRRQSEELEREKEAKRPIYHFLDILSLWKTSWVSVVRGRRRIKGKHRASALFLGRRIKRDRENTASRMLCMIYRAARRLHVYAPTYQVGIWVWRCKYRCVHAGGLYASLVVCTSKAVWRSIYTQNTSERTDLRGCAHTFISERETIIVTTFSTRVDAHRNSPKSRHCVCVMHLSTSAKRNAITHYMHSAILLLNETIHIATGNISPARLLRKKPINRAHTNTHTATYMADLVYCPHLIPFDSLAVCVCVLRGNKFHVFFFLSHIFATFDACH